MHAVIRVVDHQNDVRRLLGRVRTDDGVALGTICFYASVPALATTRHADAVNVVRARSVHAERHVQLLLLRLVQHQRELRHVLVEQLVAHLLVDVMRVSVKTPLVPSKGYENRLAVRGAVLRAQRHHELLLAQKKRLGVRCVRGVPEVGRGRRRGEVHL